MPQDLLDAEVAQATGEDIDTISLHGFVPLTRGPVETEPGDLPDPQMIDWDELDCERYVTIFP